MTLPNTTPEQQLRNRKRHYEAKYREAGNDPATLVRISFERVKSAVREAERGGNPQAMLDFHLQLAQLAERVEKANAERRRERLQATVTRHRA